MIRPNMRLIDNLITDTKCEKLQWIKLGYLKDYLKKDDISLNVVPKLREFLLYLQNERFIFDCSSTYLAIDDNVFYILSKSKYSEIYRIDRLNLDSESSSWGKLLTPIGSILRLRNAIEVVNEDDENECAELLATISLSSHV